MVRPILLGADNFTSPARTPWGGTRILGALKGAVPLAPARRAYPVVGESWELSVEPDFPSVCDDGVPLADALARDPAAMLGREAREGRTGTALLVKLLDTADALSVQIHPDDAYAGLAPDECGKPESWYVVAREPGAGLYLGLAEGVTRAGMERALADGGDVAALLGWVPVEPGDFLVIEAGTAHAIGPGLTLVEPQRVAPGRRGVTYRYWDWNRRYDARGRPDPAGTPRALHVRDALAVTRWDAPRGAAFLAGVRVRAGAADPGGTARYEPLCGAAGPVPSAYLQVARVHGTGVVEVPAWDALVGLTVVAGTVTVHAGEATVAVPMGRSAALPAALGSLRLSLASAHAVLSAAY